MQIIVQTQGSRTLKFNFVDQNETKLINFPEDMPNMKLSEFIPFAFPAELKGKVCVKQEVLLKSGPDVSIYFKFEAMKGGALGPAIPEV